MNISPRHRALLMRALLLTSAGSLAAQETAAGPARPNCITMAGSSQCACSRAIFNWSPQVSTS